MSPPAAKNARVGVGVFILNDKNQFIIGKRKGSHGAGKFESSIIKLSRRQAPLRGQPAKQPRFSLQTKLYRGLHQTDLYLYRYLGASRRSSRIRRGV